MCLASCENRPQHTAHEPQTHQKFESLKIINSRDDKIRFEFDELNAKRADVEVVSTTTCVHVCIDGEMFSSRRSLSESNGR